VGGLTAFHAPPHSPRPPRTSAHHTASPAPLRYNCGEGNLPPRPRLIAPLRFLEPLEPRTLLSDALSLAATSAEAVPQADLNVIINDNGSGSPIDPTYDVNAILARYTYTGDANLDGVINADDYLLIDQSYIGQSGPLATSAPAPHVASGSEEDSFPRESPSSLPTPFSSRLLTVLFTLPYQQLLGTGPARPVASLCRRSPASPDNLAPCFPCLSDANAASLWQRLVLGSE